MDFYFIGKENWLAWIIPSPLKKLFNYTLGPALAKTVCVPLGDYKIVPFSLASTIKELRVL